MKSFQVVGNYKPRVLSEANIRRKMNRVIASIDCPLHKGFVEIRKPRETMGLWKYHKRGVRRWHTDISRVKETKNVFILLWSNSLPTEVRNKQTKKRKVVEDGDIIVFRNTTYQHRVPPFKPRNRWFARHFWGAAGWKRAQQ